MQVLSDQFICFRSCWMEVNFTPNKRLRHKMLLLEFLLFNKPNLQILERTL